MNTVDRYLQIAIERAAEPMNPRLLMALNTKIANAKDDKAKQAAQNRRTMMQHIKQKAATAFAAHKQQPRHAIVAAIRTLNKDAQALTTFIKQLCSDAAFTAHMDLVRFERAAVEAPVEDNTEAMIALDESEMLRNPADTVKTTGFEAAYAAHAGATLDTAPEDLDTIADSKDDAYDAINRVQAWLSMAFTKMPATQAEYWGVDGLVPFMQRVDELPGGVVFSPVRDFEEYRQLQNARWEELRNSVPVSDDMLDAMLDAA